MLELPGPPAGGNKTQTQTNNLLSSFPHKFSRSEGNFFFFFLGFTQNIKITKIQLSGEEEKKKKTVRYSLGEFEIMRVTITYDSSI